MSVMSVRSILTLLFLSLSSGLSLCGSVQASPIAFSPTQSQAISEFMPSRMPIIYPDTNDFQQGTISLGRNHKQQSSFLNIQYFKNTPPIRSSLIIRHNSHGELTQHCLHRYQEKKIKHPALGETLICTQISGQSARFYAYPQKIQQAIEIVFQGSRTEMVKTLQTLKLKRLPSSQPKRSPQYAAFYTLPIVKITHPEYPLHSSQLVWSPRQPNPRLIFSYHRAVGFVKKGVTLHMQLTLTHYEVMSPKGRCRSPQIEQTTRHPKFGAFRLCIEQKKSEAASGFPDQLPIDSVIFSAEPIESNPLHHVRLRLHSFPNEKLEVLRSLKKY